MSTAPARLTRVAVVATGATYVVQQVDFRTDTVHVWGEVESYRGAQRTHRASIKLPLASVHLTYVPGGVELSRKLLAQAAAAGCTRAPSAMEHLLAGALGNAPPALTALVAKAVRS